MTRKDYVAIADALRRANPGRAAGKHIWNQWRADVLHVQNALAALNPNFDRGKFLAACGSPD